MTMTNYIKLHSRVYFCKGKLNSILIDCNQLNLYCMDNEATQFLSFLLGGNPIEEFSKSDKQQEYDFLQYLSDKNLVVMTDSPSPSHLLPDSCFDSKLKTVWFELRRACNMKCVHCYNESQPCIDDVSNGLTLNQWKEIIKQLVPYQPNVLVLIGGEPLLHKDVVEIIEYAHQILTKTEVVLYSNLSLLTDDLIKVMESNKVKVVTSLYSLDEKIHDSITQHKGSHQKTVSNIVKLKQHNVPVKANTVVMSLNEKEVKETRDYIKELTGHYPKSDVVRCVNDNLSHLKPTQISNPHIVSSPLQMSVINEDTLVRSLSGNACWQGKINISYDGYVSPCIMWENTDFTYNLKENTLKEIMDKHIMPKFWKHTKDNVEICKDCEYRYVCHECRPLSQSLTQRGNMCKYNPYTGEWSE